MRLLKEQPSRYWKITKLVLNCCVALFLFLEFQPEMKIY
ncbi:hypothetical protein LEP1GSC050_4279 [Leptospira broomii serovar Hurstbridge str. 5399]|uniref:Uncharacterized protein n=1 Tax=Leptospira broomii serovar Hurstbridge str. 5399 TaxID=1049789 RepID=T0F3Z9_9LEPT|nr:hypothetical protein LEP1GSC050_4279 [Leptospira broomii serovar Hurstbridge str. 5399]